MEPFIKYRCKEQAEMIDSTPKSIKIEIAIKRPRL
jgi:hypothetical protein